MSELASAPLPAGWSSVRPWIERLDRVSMVVLVAGMAAMTLMVSVQVFWRYVLGSSIDSADEVSRLFFVWVIFLAIPHGIKYGIHVGIDVLVTNLPARAREILWRLMAFASALLMAAVLRSAWVATIDKWPELMPTLPISAGLFYVAVLISAAHSLLHLLALAWAGSRAWEGTTL